MKKQKKFLIALLTVCTLSLCTILCGATVSARTIIDGDITRNGTVDIDDAVLLFRNSMLPSVYPTKYAGSMDFNGDGSIDIRDACRLFQHSLLPDLYPLEQPKKYFTLSFDDGITQDRRIIEILKKYNVKCASFNINTGLYGVNWDWVGPSIGDPNVTHIRFTEAELKTGIYDGFEVLSHTLNHTSLKYADSNPAFVAKEVYLDQDNIENLTGVRPIGMAWPGGDTEYTDTTVSIVYENTDIRFARGTTSTYSFALPQYFMKWMPTCGLIESNCLSLAQQFLAAPNTKDMLFYVWAHGYELDRYSYYDEFESLIRMMSASQDVYLVTNTEFYEIFKNEIPSWK